MGQGGIPGLREMDEHTGGVIVLHNPSSSFWRGGQEEGEGERWTLGSEQHLLPHPVIAYNRNMGGVDLSDQVLQYYSTHRRTVRWYHTIFLHLVDIATTNAYLLYCDISASNKVRPMSHKDFQKQLVSQLCGVDGMGVSTKRRADQIPVPITVATDASLKATQGRRSFLHCHQVDKKRNLTPWKCQSCDVALCLVVDRNCFAEWHK